MTPEDDQRMAVLVVNYGSHHLIETNLGRTDLPGGCAVIVVDNFTTIEERTSVGALCDDRGWHLIPSDENLGFGRGMNAAAEGARQIGAKVILLLNPDAHLEGDAALTLRDRVIEQPLTLISPLVLRDDGRHFSSLMELDLDGGSLRRVVHGRRYARSALWVSGACVATSLTLWDRVGGFDDDYFLYWEDIDLSWRVAQAGGRVWVDDSARAIHTPGGTQRSEQSARTKSPVYYFYNTRNRLVFAAKHLAPNIQRKWWRSSAHAGYEILSRGGRRQFLNPSRSIVPAVSGTLAGRRFMRGTSRERVR